MSKGGRMESDTTFDSVTVLRKSGPPIKTCRSQAVSSIFISYVPTICDKLIFRKY